MAKKKTASSKSHTLKNGNMLFTGSMFIGMAIGFLTDQFVVFMFLGMGVGFFLKYWVDRQI